MKHRNSIYKYELDFSLFEFYILTIFCPPSIWFIHLSLLSFISNYKRIHSYARMLSIRYFHTWLNTMFASLCSRFYACMDAEGNTVNASLVPNVTVCDLLKESHNFSWKRPDVNFDDAITAYLALLQIVRVL